MFCSNCGTEIQDTAKFCFKCGSKVYDNTKTETTSNKNAKIIVHLISGSIAAIIGFALMLFAISSYNADTSGWIRHYTYTPPFTSHEIEVIIFGIMGIVMIICGGIDIILGLTKMSATEKGRN